MGGSRFGGQPDLPEDVPWPLNDGKPLSFIAQLELSGVSSYKATESLPRQGYLWFFYDAEAIPSGLSPSDQGSWRVIYRDVTSEKLERSEFPKLLKPDSRFDACSVLCSEDISVPAPSMVLEHLGHDLISQMQYDAYWSIYEQTESGRLYYQSRHQLLGCPGLWQSPMEVECELAATGTDVLKFYESLDADSPNWRLLKAKAQQWELLMQVSWDKNPGWIWGDMGSIYFWITKSGIANQAFDGVWVMHQCA